MDCRYCGSENTHYLGIEDGGGDYGESVCEQWECYDCGGLTENCYPEADGDNDQSERFNVEFWVQMLPKDQW